MIHSTIIIHGHERLVFMWKPAEVDHILIVKLVRIKKIVCTGLKGWGAVIIKRFRDNMGRPDLYLLDLLHTKAGTPLHQLADALARAENLSYILAWTSMDPWEARWKAKAEIHIDIQNNLPKTIADSHTVSKCIQHLRNRSNLISFFSWPLKNVCSYTAGQRWSPSRGACGDATLAADLGCPKGAQGWTAPVLRGSLPAPGIWWQPGTPVTRHFKIHIISYIVVSCCVLEMESRSIMCSRIFVNDPRIPDVPIFLGGAVPLGNPQPRLFLPTQPPFGARAQAMQLLQVPSWVFVPIRKIKMNRCKPG